LSKSQTCYAAIPDIAPQCNFADDRWFPRAQ
jgi:hypothetical protein